jgi:hypothetical protein
MFQPFVIFIIIIIRSVQNQNHIMKKTWLFLMIAISFAGTLSGQFRPGYIIGNDNDTTYGYIKFEGSALNCDHCRFLSMPDSVEHIYYPGEIKAFRFEGSKYFMTAVIKENNEPKKVFIEWLVKGKASILSHNSLNMKTRFFILPVNDTLMELVNTTKTIIQKDVKTTNTEDVKYEHSQNEYIGTLLYYLRDCPSITGNIQTTSLSTGSLIKIAKKYQEKTCPGEECILFEDKDRAIKVEVGGSMSYMLSQLELNNNLPELAPLIGSIGIGIGIHLSNLPVVSPKISFTVGLDIYNLTYKYDSIAYYTHDTRICSIKYLRIPWQLNYTFLYKKFSPYISIGASTNMRFGYKEYDHYLLNMVTGHYDYNLGMSRFQTGLDAGLGFRYFVSSKTTLNIKCDYEHVFKFLGTYINEKSYNTNIYFAASVFYRLK